MTRGLIRRDPGELPAEVTGFVGRQRELAVLDGLLGTARLVTVTGPGGVGKTRIALRAAARVRGQFADGVCLAELGELHDPDLLPHTVATCLGLPGQEAGSQADAIVDYLRGRQLLLILDSCEHLIGACAKLAKPVLRYAAQVTILAASRQPMNVPGEHCCPVPPLPVPEPEPSRASVPAGRPAGATGRASAGQGGRGDAVELFAQRAAAASPGFAVTPANRREVIWLCGRLDGIPLAIELAAVQLRTLTAVAAEQPAGASLRPAHVRPPRGPAAPADAARHHAMELRPLLGGGADALGAVVGVRRIVRSRRRRGALRRRAAGPRGHPAHPDRAGRQVGGAAHGGGRRAVPAAGHHPRVRGRTAGEAARRRGGHPRPAHRVLPRPGG